MLLGSANTPPENTSWKIRMKGMTVMAAVVVRTILEMKREVISAAYVTRNRVIPRSVI